MADVFGTDSGADGGTGVAKWSRRYEHAKLGLLSQGISSTQTPLVFLSAEVVMADLGGGPCNCGVGSVRFDEATGTAQLPAQVIQSTFLIDDSPYAQLVVGAQDGVILAPPHKPALFPNPTGFRMRLGSEQAVTVDNASGLNQFLLPDKTTVTFDKGDLCIFDMTNGALNHAYVIYGNNSPTIAVDAALQVTAGVTKFLYLVGRSNGAFFFESQKIGGAGLFMTKIDLNSFSVVWARLYGGSPLQDISLGTKDVPGVGGRLGWDAAKKEVVLALPFKGTVDFGTGPLIAPIASHAVAFARIDPMTGNANAAASYSKGPAAAGKPTRARVVVAGSHYVLVDTVWDTIALGSTTLSATTPGVGDVYLATLDASGKVLGTRVVSGSGEDQAQDAAGAQDGSGDIVLSGHSASSIDFGAGPLLTNAKEGEVWIARVPSP